jgi:alpha-ketoglutarate-dependent taurine dioxygenase
MKNPPNTISGIGTAFVDDNLNLMRQLLSADGYVYLPGVPDGFDYVSELTKLGKPCLQYNGSVIRDVKPEPDIGDDVYSASNTRELTPHTESYEFDGLPPRYVVLWCVRPAEGTGGETTLADGYRFLRQFSTREQELMRSRIYEWRSNPSLASRGVRMSARHPILEQSGEDLVLRYSNRDVVLVEDGLLPRYVDRGREYFDAAKLAVRIERNAILVWDNWRMIHARNRFTDRKRHLRRLLIGAEL